MIKIIKTIETISKITFALIFALMIFSSVSANIEEPSVQSSEDESMYKYNALENKISLVELAKSSDIVLEEQPETEENVTTTNETKLSFDDELKAITKKQNFSIAEIAKAISALEDRNEVKTFLIGNNLAVLRFQLVQIREQMVLLEKLSTKTDVTLTKIQIYDQIDSLKEEQKKVEEFISDQKNEFSVFGWFVNLL